MNGMVRRLAVLTILAACGPPAFAGSRDARVLSVTAVLEAEAARARTDAQLALLLEAARVGNAEVQRFAVRALGRLERPALVENIAPALSAGRARVRAEAAHALAQAAGRDPVASRAALDRLSSRLALEKDRDVRAALCEALGRLSLDKAEDVRQVERLLLEEAARAASRRRVNLSPASPRLGVTIGWGGLGRKSASSDVIGALRGLESIARLQRNLAPLAPATAELLRALAVQGDTPARRLALLALNVSSTADAATIDRATADEDAEVRRLAMASPAATAGHLARGLSDAVGQVRYEALRWYGRRFQGEKGCRPLLDAARDGNAHVALLALDLLGSGCDERQRAEEALAREAAAPLAAGPDTTWHRPSHALVSLARLAPARARPLLPRFLAAEPWQARMYAAHAAAVLADGRSLETLAADVNANVREAAVSGLAKVGQHESDEIYLRAVAADDGQLVMAAARALAGTPRKDEARAAVEAALARWTASGSDTSRDPRLALIERLQEIGGRESEHALVPLLRDVDTQVAQRAAAALTALTGEAATPSPAPRRASPAPSETDLKRLAKARVRVTMRGGERFELQLLTEVAPLSCAAFVRLVSSRYYDGLSFHRVVPNFVVQGGSPGANEFSGGTRFMLDEVGRVTQARGTVGTSTRGRDTGDGQFYVNLVDNPRLDHDYTVFARVISGMEVVDGILEGDVMERVEVVRFQALSKPRETFPSPAPVSSQPTPSLPASALPPGGCTTCGTPRP